MSKRHRWRPARTEDVIFVRKRRDPRTGKILDARDYGYRAWPIRIRRNK